MGTIIVRGRPNPEELAALLAAVLTRRSDPPPSRYELWRRTRLAVRRS